MVEGIYTAAANMVTKLVQQELVANNLANVNATGYKRDRLYFRDLVDAVLYPALSEETNAGVVQSVTIFEPGPMEPSHSPLDLAIVGDAFFSVETEQGVAYTRNGSFALDELGYLITATGDRVHGQGGVIVLNSEGEVQVTANGEVWQNGTVVDRLALVRFADPQSLRKTGNSLFVATTEPEAVADDQVVVRQGYLEGSNVHAIEEMVEMITLLREYEADQRAIQYQDDTLRRAVNDLGRVG